MSAHDPRFDLAIQSIDAANAQDPRHEMVDGAPVATELLYSRRMSDTLARLYPAASEPLRLAVRAQHLCRWRTPRQDYPMDRTGYRRWRTELGKLHARLAGELLHSVGYPSETVARVQSLIRKERLAQDLEAQALEDTACLVFLQYELAAFAQGQEDAKLVHILGRTWGKMSAAAHAAALQLPLAGRLAELVARATGAAGMKEH